MNSIIKQRLSYCKRGILVAIMCSSLFSSILYAQENINFSSPEHLVSHLYDQVTFPAGKTPDWDYVRTLFLKEAIVVMRLGPEKTEALTLEGWVLDFENFIKNYNVKETGFEEKVVKIKSMVFGNIAHVLVLYTSYIPGKSKAPREGVDSFHLMKQEGRWWIVSILNEIPTKSRPKPEILLD
ncbi:nuclear transport factor 2 family protein [Aestuariivivens insulae]|uniref:nuclear transport factor 2 family protein n=1 Tax=Aestuariivivens insulae TaxID=1621988 RepID=UPI001F55D135|nr:nuclear transport factor 2 family protein [Aestuariivivens insulae]